MQVKEVQVAYTSDVPRGAGLSSSAAVEIGFAVLWQALGGWEIDPLELARLCQKAENEYVGVSCGIMDQFASMCGVQDHALYLDTRSLEWQPAPFRESPTNRGYLFGLYEDELKNQGFSYRIVTGLGDERLKNAVNFVNELL